MASAASFRLAAGRLDELAAECATLGRQLDRSDVPGGLTGRSRVQTRVAEAIDVATMSAEEIVATCTRLAETARQRAAECEAYESAMRSFHAAHGSWASRNTAWLASRADGDAGAPWPGREPLRPTAPDFYSVTSSRGLLQ